MDISASEAQKIIEGDKDKKAPGSSVVTADPLSGFAETVTSGVEQAYSSVIEGVQSIITPDQSGLIAALKKAGLTDAQISAMLGAGGSGSGGSSSGGGFGGFSTPDPMWQALYDTYFRLWGEKPSNGVIDRALNEGLNVFQFEDQIRQDPAFKKTETYQNEMADNTLGLARMLGILPG